MGYLTSMFEEIGRMVLPSKTILDIGAQDVSITSPHELDHVNAFVLSGGGEPVRVDAYPTVVEAREIYTRAGYAYTCIDVDERPGTLHVDLARFEIPRPRGRFGLVVNVGTTEHLASPAATFALMHEMCAEGGVMYHDVPLFGFGNHGLINPTPKFWHALIWMNRYEISSVRTRRVQEASLDRGNFFHDYLGYIEGLGSVTGISFLITAVLRKKGCVPFVVPFDAVFSDDGHGLALARLIRGSYQPFLATGAYEASEVVTGINAFMELNAKPLRIATLAELDCDVPAVSGREPRRWLAKAYRAAQGLARRR